jgi:hypothetical protein
MVALRVSRQVAALRTWLERARDTSDDFRHLGVVRYELVDGRLRSLDRGVPRDRGRSRREREA